MWLCLLCRYHPDKNANDAAAADVFKKVTFAYSILSDPNKRCQYDTSGFEVRDTNSFMLLVSFKLFYIGSVAIIFSCIILHTAIFTFLFFVYFILSF